MSGFGERKKVAPALCKANQGICIEGKVNFTRGSRKWTEEFNLVSIAAAVLKGRGHAVSAEGTFLEHRDSGFLLSPQLCNMRILDDGRVRTVTTMQANHATLVPEGVFEFQHSAGENISDAVSKGFDQWAKSDFVPLLDALRPTPQSCAAMHLEFPARDGKPARVRRAVLGPIVHFMEEPPQPEAAAEDEHPFCPCCLLTRSFGAFKELIEGNGFYGLRLFAARDQHGTAQADCRVNGEDWTPGVQALCHYAAKWPAAGCEFRKQYVVLHSIKK